MCALTSVCTHRFKRARALYTFTTFVFMCHGCGVREDTCKVRVTLTELLYFTFTLNNTPDTLLVRWRPSPPQPASPASPASLRSASPCLHIPCCLCGRAVHTCVLALCCTHDAWAAPLRGARSAPCLIVLPSPRRAQRADKRAERIAAVPRGCGQVCDDASQRCVRKKPGSESHAVLVRVSTGSWGRASSCSVKKGHRTHDNE